MGLPGAFKPGSLERRYGALTENSKNTYYALRRHLGYAPSEVDSMPWWELRMWVECLSEEFKANDCDEALGEDAADKGFGGGAVHGAKPAIVNDSLSSLGIVAHEV